MIEGWIGFCYRHPNRTLLVVALLAMLSGLAALSNLRVNTDASDMIAADLPYRQAEIAFDREFPTLDDNVALIVRAPTADAADLFVARLVDRIDSLPVVETVFAPSADPFFRTNGLLYLSEAELSDTLNQLNLSAPFLQALAADPTLATLLDELADNIEFADRADISDEILERLFAQLAQQIEAASGSGLQAQFSWQALFDTTPPEPFYQQVVQIRPVLDYGTLNPARELIDALGTLIAQLQAEPGFSAVEVGLTGTPVLRTEELRSVANGIGLSLTISLIAVSILLWLALRSMRFMVLALATLVATILITLGIASVTVGALNLVSVAFVVLLVGLGIDFFLHMALRVIGDSAADDGTALRNAHRDIGKALFLCVPTTALAFLSFMPTDFRGMAQLGLLSACGVIVAYCMTLTLLPAGMRRVGRPARRWNEEFSQALVVFRRPLALLTLGGVITSFFVLSDVRFDADPMSLRDPQSPSVQAFDWLAEDRATAPYRLQLLAADPQAAMALEEQLEALSEVDEVITLMSFIPEDQEFKLDLIDFGGATLALALQAEPRESQPSESAIGASQRLAEKLADRDTVNARRLRAALAVLVAQPELEEEVQTEVFRFWPFQLQRLREQLQPQGVSLDDLPVDLRQRFIGSTGRLRLEISASTDASDPRARRDFVDAVEAVASDVTGSARNTLRAGEAVARSMLTATVTALVLVSLVVLFSVRSVLVVALVLFPLSAAALLTVASTVWFGTPFNFANVIVLPLLLGLGVDSSIHWVLRARQGHVASSSTPRAIVFSAFTTLASFGSLMISAHRGTASMGLLLMIAIAYTLLCTLTLLPTVIEWVRKYVPHFSRSA